MRPLVDDIVLALPGGKLAIRGASMKGGGGGGREGGGGGKGGGGGGASEPLVENVSLRLLLLSVGMESLGRDNLPSSPPPLGSPLGSVSPVCIRLAFVGTLLPPPSLPPPP